MSAGSWVQLRALFRLRWQMIRSGAVRAGLLLTLLGVLWLVVLVATGTDALDPAQFASAVEVAPQAFLGFGVLAVIAPLTAGGGNEILPPDQLVAYPVRPRTQFLGGLALAPVNLVWLVQVLALVAETAVLTRGGHVLPGAATTVAYGTSLTAMGQAAAWGIVGLRQSRRGRQVVALCGATLFLLALLSIRAGFGEALLDRSPTRTVVKGVVAGAVGHWERWSLTTLGLVLLTVLGLRLGGRACGWALSRPGDAGAVRSSRIERRRPSGRSPLRTLVALDRASAWRAPALRRGALVLALLPGLAAAGAHVHWSSLVVLPGLVAAGAGLLFGINAFCLDASGALFVASLPHDPRLVARAKAIVLAETVLAAVVITAVAGSVRAVGTPTASEVIALVVGGLVSTAVVVALGMAVSVRHPHKAELKGPRDAVAPPGALTLASARLVLPTGTVAILFGGTASAGLWWGPVALAVPVLALCWLSLRRSLGLWADPVVRARIVHTVAAG